jgi:hypothetical protein
MEYAKPSMYKSGVVDVSNGGSSFSDIRTSTGSFVPTGIRLSSFLSLMLLVLVSFS